MPPQYTNIAAYKFAHLGDLKPLRERLLAQCRADGLKGTILLSTEGVNLFIAGPAAGVDRLLATLRAIPGLEALEAKYSVSEEQPFNRMLVRIKKEIIAFGVEGIDPAAHATQKLAPRELKEWLDEGRPVTLLDTRNDYEVKLGTFDGAMALGIDHFRQFPEAVKGLAPELKEQPIVMFCTGGIRCEKAGPFMEREGFRKVFQLDGGILKYFEECGGAHYDGECFVFDQRVGVDPALAETETTQCFACQAPLSAADQRDPRYDPPRSCPYCKASPAEEMAARLRQRTEAIARAADPLPGSVPAENRRPISVSAAYDGWRLLDFLERIFPHIPREEWDELFAAGRLRDADDAPAAQERVIRAGERFYRTQPESIEPAVSAAIEILYEDDAIVVLHKPAPLPVHACGRYHRNTLEHILSQVYAPEKLRPAHRLDANTTGVMVLARSRHVASRLQPQFARGEVEKVYLARVRGLPEAEHFFSEEPITDEPGKLGSRALASAEEVGLAARTDFTVLARLPNGTALLEARPRTGRTNQIRVHLWGLGFPICGDPAYLPDGQLGEGMTLSLDADPMCLHAWRLSFVHPVTGSHLQMEAPQPAWARLA